jgi:adenosylcobinamide-phosphate synthase
MWPVFAFGSAAAALLIERRFGYPDELLARFGHPVTWMGGLITFLDRNLNRPQRASGESRLRGVLALAVLLTITFLPAWLIASLLERLPLGWLAEALLATSLLAQRSLREHVEAVDDALGRTLGEARIAVGQIVGRDTAELDEPGIVRATLESLAENCADGVVAPVFWYVLGGLPGLVLYKAINTADSMIGHRSEAHLHFGWAAARLDDLVNLPCSRLTGLLFATAVPGRTRAVLAVMRRDAPGHASPNAGWPEAALAAGLDIRLGGPRSYHGRLVSLPWMGEGRERLRPADIARGLALFSRALWLLTATLVLLALLT